PHPGVGEQVADGAAPFGHSGHVGQPLVGTGRADPDDDVHGLEVGARPRLAGRAGRVSGERRLEVEAVVAETDFAGHGRETGPGRPAQRTEHRFQRRERGPGTAVLDRLVGDHAGTAAGVDDRPQAADVTGGQPPPVPHRAGPGRGRVRRRRAGGPGGRRLRGPSGRRPGGDKGSATVSWVLAAECCSSEAMIAAVAAASTPKIKWATANTQGVMTWAAAGSTACQMPNCMTSQMTGPNSAPLAMISERGPGRRQAASTIREPKMNDTTTCTTKPMITEVRLNFEPSGAERHTVLVMRFSRVQNPVPMSHKMNISHTAIMTPPMMPPMAPAFRAALIMAASPHPACAHRVQGAGRWAVTLAAIRS